MGLIAQESGGNDFDPIPPGVHIGICYGIIDLGSQFSASFNKWSRKVVIQWELPNVRGEFERDGQMEDLPRAISKRYTVSLSEKANLRHDLESWRGKRFTPAELAGFDLQSLLGVACQLQVVEGMSKAGKAFADIRAIMALPKGTVVSKRENPIAFFSLDDAGSPIVLPDTLPNWVKAAIMLSREWTSENGGNTAPAASQAAIPARSAHKPLPKVGSDPDWLDSDPDDVPMGKEKPQEVDGDGKGFNPNAWRECTIPYGEDLGIEMFQQTKAKLYADWANFDPATAECDKGLGIEYRDMLDLAGAYYKFKKA